jgi:DNA-binding PadR family transcriptional regulator
MDPGRARSQLTTTAYAILGVLAIKPRSAYELAAEMRHCFEYFWPRDDVRVYQEAKALAASGLVRSKRELIGRRPRTAYSILPAGRRALKAWLAAPSRSISLEFEGLVKIYLARFGTLEQLRATVAQARDDAEFMLRVATNVREVYRTNCAPFQDEYVHVWAFVYMFLAGWFRHQHDWATAVLAEIDSWTDLSPERKRSRAMELFDERVPATWLEPELPPPARGVPAMPGQWRRRVGGG